MGADGLVLAVGLVAALPVLVSTAHAIVSDWTPVLDDGIIATNAFDALTGRARLVGVFSDASRPGHDPVYTLGPLLFWLLTLQTHLFGDWALPATAGLVNTGSIVGVVALARRHGGPLFMFATAIAVILMCGSVPPETWHDIFNPWVVLLPFTLLLFLSWSLACGEYRLLPLATLVVSFVAQTHFSVGPPSVAVFLVGLGGLAIWVVRHPRADRGGADLKRWMLAAVAVAALCWSAPLIDEAIHSPGNLTRTVETAAAGEEHVGRSSGWHALARAIGVRPWWLREPPTPVERVFEVVGRPPTLALVSSLLMLACLVAVGAIGLRRRRADIAAAALLALVVSGAVLFVVASTPARLAFHIEKATRWTSPAGMFVWLVLGWALATLLLTMDWRAVQRLRSAAAARGRPVTSSLLGLAATALIAVVVASKQEPDQFQATYRPARTIASHLTGQLSDERPVLVVSAGSFDRAFAIEMALVYRLRQRGYEVVTAWGEGLDVPAKLGPAYSPTRHPPGDGLLIDDRKEPARLPGARVVARVRLPAAPGNPSSERPTLTASMAPAAAILALPGPPH